MDGGIKGDEGKQNYFGKEENLRDAFLAIPLHESKTREKQP